MSIAPEGAAFLDIIANYTRSGLLFCIVVQIISIVAGRLLSKPTLQRMAITMTCSFAAFSAGVHTTDSHTTWVLLFFVTFCVTYFYTPKFVGEKSGRGTNS